MNRLLAIANITIGVIMIALGVDTIIKSKKIGNKNIDEVSKSLVIRFTIIGVLMVIMSALTVINVLINS